MASPKSSPKERTLNHKMKYFKLPSLGECWGEA